MAAIKKNPVIGSLIKRQSRYTIPGWIMLHFYRKNDWSAAKRFNGRKVR